jgi:hypothetical protein
VCTYGVWQGAYLTEALHEHSTKVGAEGRVAAVGIKLAYLTQRANKGVGGFDLLSSIVHNAPDHRHRKGAKASPVG